MRSASVACVVLLSGAVVAAQRAHPAPPPPRPPQPNPGTFVTPTPPPVMLPFQQPAPQPAGGVIGGAVFPAQVNPAFIPGRSGRNSRGAVYGAPYFYAPYPADGAAAPTASASAPGATGMLRLSGTPESAQVFVDGFYVATLADVEAQRVLMLATGPHRVELRASGYATTTFDVRIDPNAAVTYHAALEHARPEAPHAAPGGATKMYLIPNCYLGNIPPKPERLPRGCDAKRVQVIGDRAPS